ncbi:dual specificity tyrosine-phosphorylation-regulated kinase 2-like [Scleropages formosus]|uniref:dual-specificity kinase n=1 Tax=Scleropages formosus TaxID=113540 RepID=A0A0P7TLT6_SCLFO|nr:dual specificity tyrosine-phosphorylation-regulated kinase 2-like [Scleropages formosus]
MGSKHITNNNLHAGKQQWVQVQQMFEDNTNECMLLRAELKQKSALPQLSWSASSISPDCKLKPAHMTPVQAMKHYKPKMTQFEHREIFSYSKIFFVGQNAKKRPGVFGASNNCGYDDDQGSYIFVPHDHLAYRYEVLKVIGTGTFGQVVRVYDHKTHQQVAIKMVRNKKRFHRLKLLDVSKRVQHFISPTGYPWYCKATSLPDGSVILNAGRSSGGKVRGPPGSKKWTAALKGCDDPLFLEFLKQCLEWDPSLRMTALQALHHPWLNCCLPFYLHGFKPFFEEPVASKHVTNSPLHGEKQQRVQVQQMFENTGEHTVLRAQQNGLAPVNQTSLPTQGKHQKSALPQLGCCASTTISCDRKFRAAYMTPAQALKHYKTKLTQFEHREIFNYSKIFFVGQNAKKRPGVLGASNNCGYDDDQGSYIFVPHDHLAYRYEVLKIIGTGTFGQVVQVYDHKTHQQVAIKMIYTYIQTRFYRAPEVILGSRYGMPIDMWSFGCILVELLTGYPLFPGEDEEDQLACIIELLGMPPQKVLNVSKRAKNFISPKGYPRYCKVSTLPDGSVVLNAGRSCGGEVRGPPGTKEWKTVLKGCDDLMFLEFLKQCLEWDPSLRMTPLQALHHPWLKNGLIKPPCVDSGLMKEIPESSDYIPSVDKLALPLSLASKQTNLAEVSDANGNVHLRIQLSELAKLKQAPTYSRQEDGQPSGEGETLRDLLEDTRRRLKLSGEELAKVVSEYTEQLNALTSKLEQERKAREMLEKQERSNEAMGIAERILQQEREYWQQEKPTVEEAGLSVHTLCQQLGNELHCIALSINEKSLLVEMVHRERDQAQARLAEMETILKAINRQDSTLFLDFMKQCLDLDPSRRMTLSQALHHPWIKKCLLKPPTEDNDPIKDVPESSDEVTSLSKLLPQSSSSTKPKTNLPECKVQLIEIKNHKEFFQENHKEKLILLKTDAGLKETLQKKVEHIGLP